MKAAQVWQAALGELQLEMTRATFDTWLRDARLVAYEDGTFVIGVKNGYAKDWLENRLATTVERALARLSDGPVRIRFVVWERPATESFPAPLNPDPAPPRHMGNQPSFPFNPRYTFDCFVVGPSNRLAYAAAMAAVDRPADCYNPLFLYGGVGLGKTHLLQAIGHACRVRNMHVLYVPAETFTNDLIEAIRSYSTESFRDTYRTADVLLIDDIHFIAGKEATQEEFFHTFNALHASGAQIIISSDRSPRAMPTLEERLRSRFEWGLMVDIGPPSLETRVAILRRKAELQDVPVSNDVLYLIAERVQTNIRELEGALNRTLMLSSVEGVPPSAHLVEAALSYLESSRANVGADEIIALVVRHYGISAEELAGKSRSRRLAFPRQVAMYLLRQETDYSLSQIGEALGGRDHSTVLHGYEKISSLIEQDEAMRRELLGIRELLYQKSPSPVA
jgi:chromosomal replication initiator protein